MEDDADDLPPDYSPRKRSITVKGRKTSIALTDSLWDELKALASRDGVSVNYLVSRIRDRATGNLAAAIRMHIVNQRDNVRHDGD